MFEETILNRGWVASPDEQRERRTPLVLGVEL